MTRVLSTLCSLGIVLLTVVAMGSRAHAASNSAQAMPPGPVLTIRRFALVVGANDGGGDRPVLRFANSDAQAVGSVLGRFGGVGQGDLQELFDPTPAQLSEAIASMSDRIRRARRTGQHVQFVFYYSGHSDEQGLLLAGQLVDYKSLRKEVQAVPADVRIAVLDSCASGAFTRTKGGTKRAPFLVSPAAEVKGHAFLTSSSMDEAAQESDRVGGSFFTHYFTTGLRGAADLDGDRLVTLSEAYQFAFDETLARTEATRGGAQHAAYDIQLAGTGDLVMTDLRETTARLLVTEEVGGRISVRNKSGDLAAEMYKPPGSAVVGLALEPGLYQVTVDDGQLLWRAEVSVKKGQPVELTRLDLVRVRPEDTVTRGGAESDPAAPAEDADADADEPANEYKTIPFNFGLLPPLSVNGQDHSGKKIINTASAAVLWSEAAKVDGIAVAMGGSRVTERMHGAQLAFGGNVAGHADGVQLSTGFNHAKSLSGMQGSLVNHADEADTGFQAGAVNVVGNMRGAQLGFINVGGEVKGAQVGIINVSRQADAAVGLLSFTREGNVHPEISLSDTAALNLGLRFPARYTYTFLEAGVQPSGRGSGWQIGLGFGGTVPLPHSLRLDFDVATYAAFRGLSGSAGQPDLLNKLRILIGWQPFDRLTVFGGPVLNVFSEFGADAILANANRPGLYQYNGLDIGTGSDPRIRVWPGFAVGVRF